MGSTMASSRTKNDVLVPALKKMTQSILDLFLFSKENVNIGTY